jgi:hypothetical protein
MGNIARRNGGHGIRARGIEGNTFSFNLVTGNTLENLVDTELKSYGAALRPWGKGEPQHHVVPVFVWDYTKAGVQ